MINIPKQRKIRVFVEAYTISNDRLSGVGHLIENMVKYFDQNPSDMEFILVSSPAAINKLKKKYNFSNLKYKKIFFPRIIFNNLCRWGLMIPVDWFLGSGVYIFPNNLKWPLSSSKSLLYIHDLAFIKFPETLNPKVLRRSKYYKKWVNKCTRIISISESTKKDVQTMFGIKSSNINVVGVGVDTSVFFNRSKLEINKVLSKYELPKKYILFVSSIEPRKDLDTLLDAYVKLPKSIIKQYSLVVIGGYGWNNNSTFDTMNKLRSKGYSIIQPSHYVIDDDLPAVYSGSKILVHPALYEGFGISPLQAIAVGKNIIIADNSSLKEIYSKVGVMFKTGDPDDLAKKIKLTLSKKIDPRERKMILEKYTWMNSGDSLIDIIKSL